MPHHLPGILHSLEPTLNQFGYLAVGGVVLIEDFGVPVPVPFMVAAGLSLLNALYGYFVLPESLPKEKRRAFDWKRANPARVQR